MKLVVGKTVKIKCMRPGPCKYSDEMVYLGSEALAKMAETCYGIPVVIHHKIVDSSNVNTAVVGRVADMHLGENGEWWVHMVIDDADAADKLANGWGVSTAYRITESGAPGSFNAIPYDREVLNGKYDHVAITDTPRYEFAVDPIFYNSADLQAVNTQGTIETVLSIGGNMFSKIFKKTREEIKENSAEDFIFVKADGGEVSVAALLKNEQDAEEKYNGLMARFNELEEKYNALLKKNEEDEAKEKEEKEKEAKENEEREAKEKEAKEKEDKENALRFNALRNASQVVKPEAPKYMSEFQKVQAGRAAYGSK